MSTLLSIARSIDLKTVNNHMGRKQTWILKHHSAGVEIAASATRQCSEHWSVTTFDRQLNATLGHSYQTEQEARDYFAGKEDAK